MRLVIPLIGAGALAAVLLWAQRERPGDHPAYEIRSILPREVSPAQYQQVDPRELQALADQGWELVSVVPYIYKNEERGTPAMAPRPMVTQTYPAYFFRRLKTFR
ncbi:MAG TPA: hypothetical protein VEV17_26525 [Bryobacteraceae bacterium]|nr:hypothetical protein [Bryobacteraceae bacterium]